MKKIHLPRLAEDVHSWTELETRIASLPSEQERGDAFEEFCHAFFTIDPLFQFTKVYRQKEIPLSVFNRLGYPVIKDIGIDGIALTEDDKVFAYQAKFRTDRNNTPSLRELGTFFTMSDKADWRIVITNADSLPAAINNRINHSKILSDTLDQLEPDFFRRLKAYLEENRIERPKAKKPHITQRASIEEAISHFRKRDRGQLILPCGTGKTLAALWIAERLSSVKILVLVPSLYLLRQTLRAWAENSTIRPFTYLCLCSDTTVDLGNDSPIESIHDLEVPVTTDKGAVTDFLVKHKGNGFILFSTYQSSKVLSDATLEAGIRYDFAVFDEAHRTAGVRAGVWNIALDDVNVLITKRLCMTATPRIYQPHIIKKAEDEDVLICSMDDHKVYGEPFYEMRFGQAIDRGHITDYKVVVIFVTDTEVGEIIQRGGRVIAGEHEWDAKALAKRIALVKGINAYSLKKIFTFHGKVAGAKAFTDTQTPYGIHEVMNMLDEGNNFAKKVKCFHVNGTMSSGVRSGLMIEFKSAEMGIMSNARCLTEGVDVPAVDTVAFIDPKRSLIDIIQATGRALRKAEWKDRGYIFIPVIIDDRDPEQVLESSDFATVWQVLQAMRDQDQRLEDIISNLRVIQGKGEEDTQRWKDAMTEFTEKIEFFNLPTRIDKARLFKSLETKIIEVIGKKCDYWYGLTLRFKEQNNGDPNAPARYVFQGFKLGQWQSNLRKSYKQNKLSPVRVRKMEEIGFVWDPLASAFEEGFQKTLRFMKQNNGNPNAPQIYVFEDFKLGSWQSELRKDYKQNKLSHDKVLRMNEIGFVWDRFDFAFEKGFQKTLEFKRQNNGNPNAPTGYVFEGFNLGQWQSSLRQRYKQDKLSSDKIHRMEEIGFIWDHVAFAFEKGFQKTLRFKEQNNGNPNAPTGYVFEGFNLGIWQSELRRDYGQNKLSSDRIHRLEGIGFMWDMKASGFEEGFQKTLRFKEQNHGDPNAPARYVFEGFKLGQWQSNLRKSYKQNKLSPVRVRRMEEIGFVWDPSSTAFEEGFRKTLQFKQQNNGDPNAPDRHVFEGFKLGQWQSNLRKSYKQKKLTPNRVRRMEKNGFVWDPLASAFEEGFQKTLRFKEQNNGDPNAPARYIFEGFKLGSWQHNIKTRYRQNKLSADRIRMMEEIGVRWTRRGQR